MKFRPSRRVSTILLVLSLSLLGGAVVFAVLKVVRNASAAPLKVEPHSRTATASLGQGTVSVSYLITNVSRRVIDLGEVSTSCGCSVASISRKQLAPGERAEVEVRGNPPSAGRKAVEIYIQTSDPTLPEVALHLVMIGSETAPIVVFHSLSVSFGSMPQADSAATTEILVNTREVGGTPPWISRAESSIEGLTVEGGLASESDQGDSVVARKYTYRAALNAQRPPGELDGLVRFMPREGDAPILMMPILGEIRPSLIPEPRSLYASVRPNDKTPRLRLDLVSSEANFDPEDVEPGPPPRGVRISRTEAEAGRAGFEVEVDPGEVPGSRVVIGFRCRKPGASQVEIPLVLRRLPAD